ncbi:MAG: 2-isopropylmalate synthase [Alphaproteobacteria bacterium CG11_big_fil_rev_8_21_14_0_20_39_49]|nr:MAG: 2-isopropylmalate synthase [Alphaproteobacteria bacterium CG11_big_fil_rev_8_21_14_0_20_39_49]
MTKDKIKIFDTTLRDGEQSPGATMNMDEKILIAETLDKMGVDIIEAGFAIASKGDFEAVNKVAKKVKNATVCSLARTVKADIEAAAEAIKPAKRGRIHTFISTSPIHMKHKLNMNEEQVLERTRDMVKLARNLCDDVEWSAEDATRTDHDFLCKTVEAAIAAGATTINLPDTVGYTTPLEYAGLIAMIKNRVPNVDKAVLSVHCHNDLGLAVANSLAAVSAGARQIECTINGLGERAGNAAMEEIVMAIKTRNDIMPYDTNIDTTQIMRASKLVSTVTGFVVQNNKAIVGANAFAHESGVHQDGMLKNASTYEIMTPESVGLHKSKLVMGKLSGRHAFKNKLEELGFELGDNAFEEAFNNFKNLADKKKEIYDEDIIALIDNSAINNKGLVELLSLQVHCGSVDDPKAVIKLAVEGKTKEIEATGDGPVDAIFNGIKKLVTHDAKLELYQVHAVTGGTDAQAEVTVRLNKDGKIISGNYRDTDTLVASAGAYIAAVNKLKKLDENANKEHVV